VEKHFILKNPGQNYVTLCRCCVCFEESKISGQTVFFFFSISLLSFLFNFVLVCAGLCNQQQQQWTAKANACQSAMGKREKKELDDQRGPVFTSHICCLTSTHSGSRALQIDLGFQSF
jgi:hypothetical protein